MWLSSKELFQTFSESPPRGTSDVNLERSHQAVSFDSEKVMTPGRRSVRILLLVQLGVLGPSCTPEQPTVVLGFHEFRGSNDVALSGTLVVQDGCLMVMPEAGGNRIMLAWPRGFTVARSESEGDVTMITDAEERVASMGDMVSLGGGPVARDQIVAGDGGTYRIGALRRTCSRYLIIDERSAVAGLSRT